MQDIISLYKLLNDSVMTKAEIIDYIMDDFRVDFHLLRKVTIYKYKQDINKPNAHKIPHHRYNLLFENGELSISPYDGALRITHISIEIQLLELYFNKKIELQVVDGNALAENILDSAIADIISNLRGGNLRGVIVGSIWNINFLINHRIRPHIYQALFSKLDEESLKRYISHRLKVSNIEDALLSGALDTVESCIFQEGHLPSEDIFNYVDEIYKNWEFEDEQNELLNDYLAMDYVFFNDLKSGTKLFDETTVFPETQIFSNSLLTYQIIDLPNKKGKYLNVSWIEPTNLGYILEKIQNLYNYQEFLMYGKCGALEKSIKVGSLVAPTSVFGEKLISISNSVQDIPTYDFISVESPLLETNIWLENALSLNLSCVEMELYDIFKRIKAPNKVEITYYVSDNLSSKFKLSNRLDFLHQRLHLAERIVNNLF